MSQIKIQLDSFRNGYATLKEGGEHYCKAALFIDYLYSAVRYGSSASDYFDFDFYDKRHHARNRFFCYRLKRKMFRTLQDYNQKEYFDDKVKFLRKFDKFVGREWLFLREAEFEDFERFCQKHSEIVIKPYNSSGGRGVERISVENADLKALYEKLKQDDMLVEEVIQQNHEIDRIYAGSLNTLRIATVLVNGEMRILAAAFRCGSGNAKVDNFTSGGLAVCIDPATGTLVSDGRGHGQLRCVCHPDTGTMFHGFKIPNWEYIKSMLEEATRVVPGVGYTGWDVAVRENDAVLVEGNFEGMIHLLQRPADRGIKKDVEEILKLVSEKKA